ncbi:hypothetical protein BX666DRAFT_687587 [Dichotomocladium elegans]|nr:hypothetical protein BX666DRAFT_687587 [Dichotomocladium elegans]
MGVLRMITQKLFNQPLQASRNPTAPAIYAKDLSCPSELKAALTRFLPEYLLPFTTSDLFSCIPPRLAAEHLMCYVGSHRTGTAMHRDLCSTIGHNIMIYADEGGFSEWLFIPKEQRDELLEASYPNKSDSPALPPSAINKRYNAAGVSKSTFLESDRAWISKSSLKKSGIRTQVVIQRPGDLVLIPSMCYHQVRNVGTSVKAAWNRASAYSLRLALENQLPIYQTIIRPELYRCKAMVYYSLCNWSKKIRSCLKSGDRRPDWTPWFREECEILCNTFLEHVIYPEMVEAIPSEGVSDEGIDIIMSGTGMYTKTCNFCHADIFNRHYHCTVCQDFDLCLLCYSQGRGCAHMDTLTMYQGSTSLKMYIDIYASFIETMNEAFERFAEGWKPLDYILNDENQSKSLATICRRIEAYRRRNGLLSNYFACGHCNAVVSLHDLYAQDHLDLEAVFGQHLCRALAEDDKNNIVYVCAKCSKECQDGCETLSPRQHEMVQRVFYTPPDHDNRTWGGPSDWGMYNFTGHA